MSLRATGSILIVDDEAIIRDSLQQWLEIEGFRVFSAEDGERALQLCRFERLDVGVFDIRMPGMDGITLLNRTRSCRPEMDVIMMTAFASIEDAVRCISEGAHDYIIKPFPPEKLSKSIRHLLESRKLHATQRDLISQQGELSRFFAACTPYLALGAATAVLSGAPWAEQTGSGEAALEPSLLKELIDRALEISRPAEQTPSSNLRSVVETALLLAETPPEGRARLSPAPPATEMSAGIPFVPAILALQLLFEHLLRHGHPEPIINLEAEKSAPLRPVLRIGLAAPMSVKDRAQLLEQQEGGASDSSRLRLAATLLRILGVAVTVTPRREEGETILLIFPTAEVNK